MAVTRADKEQRLTLLETAFRGSETAVLVDFKGLDVPQVTELRRQLRAAKASYTVVKNTLAQRAAVSHHAGIRHTRFCGAQPFQFSGTGWFAQAHHRYIARRIEYCVE